MIQSIISKFFLKRNLKRVIYGLAVGDALGVPYEFSSREKLDKHPASNMIRLGTHQQEGGTWSDDTSLTLCLLHSLKNGYDLKDIANNFIQWREYGAFTAHGYAFDIGYTTYNSINYLIDALATDKNLVRYSEDGMLNGNGSLMRISPLLFYFKKHKLKIEDEFNTIHEVSSLTHPHVRSTIACLIYLILMDELLQATSIEKAYSTMQTRMMNFKRSSSINRKEWLHFRRVLINLTGTSRDEIKSDGYVIHTLEASIWCLLNSKSYKEATLKAVNLGSDTDTTAAITGSLAALHYGAKSIPKQWLKHLQNRDLIDELIKSFV